MNDLERTKHLLAKNHYSLVLCQGAFVVASRQPGLRPLAQLFSGQTDWRGCSAADRIVGRAAALLYAGAGVKSLHATVLSEPAHRLCADAGMAVSGDFEVPAILGRLGHGGCPMEALVAETNDPAVALQLLQIKLFGRAGQADTVGEQGPHR